MARVAASDDLVGPNPSLRPIPPSASEATLPPLSPAPPVESDKCNGDGDEFHAPETPRATKLRAANQAVQFGDHSYEVNDEESHDFDCDDVWEAETNLWSGASEASREGDDEEHNRFSKNLEAYDFLFRIASFRICNQRLRSRWTWTSLTAAFLFGCSAAITRLSLIDFFLLDCSNNGDSK